MQEVDSYILPTVQEVDSYILPTVQDPVKMALPGNKVISWSKFNALTKKDIVLWHIFGSLPDPV